MSEPVPKETPKVPAFDMTALAEALAPMIGNIVDAKLSPIVQQLKRQTLAHGYAVQPDLLSGDECDRLSELMDRTLEQVGQDGTIKAEGITVNKKIRNARLTFINPYKPPELFTPEDAAFVLNVFMRMVGLAHVTQGSTLRGTVAPLAGMPSEQMQFTEYRRGHHYAMHQDSDGGNVEQRALSMSLLVEGAEKGGDFRFRDVEIEDRFNEQVVTRGSALVFPSSAYHGIEKVQKGRRRSIVMWFNALRVAAKKTE